MSYIKGQWSVWCPVCGFEYKSGQMKRRWDGIYVCQEDWEPRHPLDYLKIPQYPREGTVPFSQREPEETGSSPGGGGGDLELYVEAGYIETVGTETYIEEI